MRDRHHAVAADRADGGFDADDAVDRARRDDGAVGLGADRHHGQAGGDRHCGARARAAGAAVERIGLRVSPPRELQPDTVRGERQLAHSDRLVLPGSRRRPRAAARPEGVARRPRADRASEPAVVSILSALAILSLSSTGMPCGPRTRPACRSASSPRAMSMASGLISITALRQGPWRSMASMRSRQAATVLRLSVRPPSIALAGRRCRLRRWRRWCSGNGLPWRRLRWLLRCPPPGLAGAAGPGAGRRGGDVAAAAVPQCSLKRLAPSGRAFP